LGAELKRRPPQRPVPPPGATNLDLIIDGAQCNFDYRLLRDAYNSVLDWTEQVPVEGGD